MMAKYSSLMNQLTQDSPYEDLTQIASELFILSLGFLGINYPSKAIQCLEDANKILATSNPPQSNILECRLTMLLNSSQIIFVDYHHEKTKSVQRQNFCKIFTEVASLQKKINEDFKHNTHYIYKKIIINMQTMEEGFIDYINEKLDLMNNDLKIGKWLLLMDTLLINLVNDFKSIAAIHTIKSKKLFEETLDPVNILQPLHRLLDLSNKITDFFISYYVLNQKNGSFYSINQQVQDSIIEFCATVHEFSGQSVEISKSPKKQYAALGALISKSDIAISKVENLIAWTAKFLNPEEKYNKLICKLDRFFKEQSAPPTTQEKPRNTRRCNKTV